MSMQINRTQSVGWNVSSTLYGGGNRAVRDNMPREQMRISPARSDDMRQLRASFDRLDSIADLEDGWDGYAAKAFSNKLVQKCKAIVGALQSQPRIYPTGRQSIQLQYESEDRSYLEFEVFESKTDSLFVPQRRYAQAEEKTISVYEIDTIKRMVDAFHERRCDL